MRIVFLLLVATSATALFMIFEVVYGLLQLCPCIASFGG